jgi:hypothetical protein
LRDKEMTLDALKMELGFQSPQTATPQSRACHSDGDRRDSAQPEFQSPQTATPTIASRRRGRWGISSSASFNGHHAAAPQLRDHRFVRGDG